MSRLLLIHLSDLHIFDNNSFCDERKSSINEILSKEIKKSLVDEAVILFTGDISWAGKKDQFDIASRYVNSLIKSVKSLLPETFVGFYSCPGNHDIDFDLFENLDIELLDRYKQSQCEFFDFANKQSLFTENKEFHLATYKVNNSKVKIDFFILNSTFGSKKIESDKGLHYLSSDTIQAMRKFNSDNRTILLMHHFDDYFDEASSIEIQNFIKEKCDFVFFGHTHKSINGSYRLDDQIIGISQGGALQDNEKGSVFSVTLLETDDNQYTSRVYVWEQKTRIYNFEKEFINEYNLKTHVDKDFFITNYSQILDIPNAKLSDIFVFPDLISDNIQDNKISKFDKFLNLISEEDIKYIVIKGYEKSGKSFFARYIYDYYARNQGHPLIINKYSQRKSFDITIKEAYRNQYNISKMDVYRFLKNNHQNKILIIDDSNTYSSVFLADLISNYECFDKIILMCNDKKYISLYNNGFKNVDTYQVLTFEIQPFIVNKRNELFTKTLLLTYPDIEKSIITKTLKEMDKIITEQISIVTTNPEFLILFVKSFGNRALKSAGSNIFNEVFESNIIISLSRYNEIAEKKIDTSIALGLLESLGHTCFKNSKNIFKEKDLIDIVTERNGNSNFKKEVNFTDYHTAFTSSRIICEKDVDSYAFMSNSYLSYFAARYLKRLIKQKKYAQFESELQYLSDNISYDLCGDILLFLCYQTGDMSIIEHLVKKANDFYDSIESLDLNKNKISFLFSNALPKRTIPTYEDHKSSQKKQETKEQKALTIREKNDFEREANDIANFVFDGFRFVELIGKILPDFIENIDDDELILNCVTTLYDYTHRFLFQLLSPIDELIKNDKQKLEKMTTYDVLVEQDINDFEKRESAVAYQVMRMVYSSISRFSSSENTIKALDSFDQSSVFQTIENLYMHSSIEGDEQFIKTFKSARKLLNCKYKKRNFFHNLLEDAFHLYMLKYDFKYFGDMQELIDTTFLTPEKGKTKSSKKFISNVKKGKR